MQFSIREFRETDRCELRKLYMDVRYESFEWLRKDNFIKDSFDSDTDGEWILVAEYNGKPAGFLSIWLPDRFVHHLYVASEVQRMGIGGALIRAALAELGYPFQLKCLQNNIRATSFYNKTGWRAKAEGVSAEGFYTLFELQQPDHAMAGNTYR